jgi:hypothetical protein
MQLPNPMLNFSQSPGRMQAIFWGKVARELKGGFIFWVAGVDLPGQRFLIRVWTNSI